MVSHSVSVSRAFLDSKEGSGHAGPRLQSEIICFQMSSGKGELALAESSLPSSPGSSVMTVCVPSAFLIIQIGPWTFKWTLKCLQVFEGHCSAAEHSPQLEYQESRS